MCARCQRCDEPGSIIILDCPSHGYICKECVDWCHGCENPICPMEEPCPACNTMYCEDCMEECFSCDTIICKDCGQQCYFCKKSICKLCNAMRTNDDFEDYPVCQECAIKYAKILDMIPMNKIFLDPYSNANKQELAQNLKPFFELRGQPQEAQLRKIEYERVVSAQIKLYSFHNIGGTLRISQDPSSIINELKKGDTIKLKIWTNPETMKISIICEHEVKGPFGLLLSNNLNSFINALKEKQFIIAHLGKFTPKLFMAKINARPRKSSSPSKILDSTSGTVPVTIYLRNNDLFERYLQGIINIGETGLMDITPILINLGPIILPNFERYLEGHIFSQLKSIVPQLHQAFQQRLPKKRGMNILP